MSWVMSDEQRQLRSTVDEFLTKTSPESQVRRLMETDEGHDSAVWRQMANQLGLQGLHVPEEYGGSGFGYVELAIVAEQLGSHLTCTPFLASAVLATGALLESGDHAAAAELLPGLIGGDTIGTVALHDPTGRWAHPDPVVASAADGGHTLDGTAGFVLDGTIADIILVFAELRGTTALFAVDNAAAGLTTTALPMLDLTRKQADVRFDATPARLIETVVGADAVRDRVLALAGVAVANESVGGAQAVLDMSVRYAKQRFQFGRAIGSFQAIKHKCADMLTGIEQARSAAYHAATIAADDPDSLPLYASLAKSYVGEVYLHATEENIQIHGGIGFTWEHPAHLYLRRAKASAALFGDPVAHREKIADLLAI